VKKLLVISVVLAGLAVPAGAHAAPKPCKRIVNPYAGTRYEGSDLYRIRARKTTCRTARRVVRRGHRKALADTPDRYGIVRVTYRRWTIAGDLTGDHDHYFATAPGGKRVTWLF